MNEEAQVGDAVYTANNNNNGDEGADDDEDIAAIDDDGDSVERDHEQGKSRVFSWDAMQIASLEFKIEEIFSLRALLERIEFGLANVWLVSFVRNFECSRSLSTCETPGPAERQNF